MKDTLSKAIIAKDVIKKEKAKRKRKAKRARRWKITKAAVKLGIITQLAKKNKKS